MHEHSCGTVALMVLGQFTGPQVSENWPRTIRATVPQLSRSQTQGRDSLIIPIGPYLFIIDSIEYMDIQQLKQVTRRLVAET